MLILNFLTVISFLIVGAYATTDIKRLSKGASVSINDSASYCDNCKIKLSLSDQIPLVSYIINKGRCKHCHAKIPFSEFLFEFLTALSFSAISFTFSFSIIGFILLVSVYETFKLLYLLIKGFREIDFKKQYIISLLNNVNIFLLIGCIFMFQNALRV